MIAQNNRPQKKNIDNSQQKQILIVNERTSKQTNKQANKHTTAKANIEQSKVKTDDLLPARREEWLADGVGRDVPINGLGRGGRRERGPGRRDVHWCQ